MTRPFRFAVTGGGITEPGQLVDVARRAGDLGYSALTLPDHLDIQVGPLVGLTAVAMATSTLRITTMVLANDYRHPAVLAKELATLDRVSQGRLEVGIGAGWMTADYEQAGIELNRPGVRIDRLAEAITVLKGCFAEGPFDFSGEHYSIKGLDSQPKPLQKPHPPLVVAGGGPKVLALAARTADIVGLNPNLKAGVVDASVGASATAAATDAKIATLRDAAGKRFDDIEIQTGLYVATIHEDRWALARALAGEFGLDPENALASPHALIGTVDECVATIEGWRERWGISYLALGAEAMTEMAGVVERLAGR